MSGPTLCMSRTTLLARIRYVIFSACVGGLFLGGMTGFPAAVKWYGIPLNVLIPLSAMIVVGVVQGCKVFRAPASRVLRLGEEAAILPAGRHTSRSSVLRYASIRSIAWTRGWPWHFRRLFIAVDSGRIVALKSSGFDSESDLSRFVRALELRIEASDPTHSRIEAIRRRARPADAAMTRPPVATIGTVAVIVAALFLQRLSGPFDAAHILWQGSTAGWLISVGEWQRIFVGGVLHRGFFHAFVNIIMIGALGPLIEGLLGTMRTVIVLWVATVAGSIGLLLLSERAGVGASSAGFGLIGALFALNLTDRECLPAPFFVSLPVFGLGLASVLIVAVAEPGVASSAHLGGFLGGLSTTLVLRPGLDLNAPVKTTSSFVKGWALIGGVAFAICIGTGLREALQTTPKDALLQSALAFESSVVPDYRFEAYAALLAEQPDVSRSELSAIRPILLERARSHGRVSASVAAYVESLMGDPARARQLQELAARGSNEVYDLVQLAAYRVEAWRNGVLDSESLGARIHREDSDHLVVMLDAVHPYGFVLDVLVAEDERVLGILRLTAGPGLGRRIESPSQVGLPRAQVSKLQLIVVGLRSTASGDESVPARERVRWWYRPIHPGELDLPSPLAE